MARREPVPGCLRIQPIISLSSMVTKNMRSASVRWAMETTDTRGLPDSVYNRVCASSGTPCIQLSKPGAASRLFSCIAS